MCQYFSCYINYYIVHVASTTQIMQELCLVSNFRMLFFFADFINLRNIQTSKGMLHVDVCMLSDLHELYFIEDLLRRYLTAESGRRFERLVMNSMPFLLAR